MNLTPDQWRQALQLSPHESPKAVILEGTWWEREAQKRRTTHLNNVRELPFPGWWWGEYNGTPLLYATAYGAPKAVEPVHVAGVIGAKLAVQIGSCGSLQHSIQTGDVVVPLTAEIGEGASVYYGGFDVAVASRGWANLAAEHIQEIVPQVHLGRHITTSALLAQPPETVKRWHEAGYSSVDMETSAVFTAAHAFGMQAVSILFVWDELLRDRGFLATFSDEETERQKAANDAVFETSLRLTESLAS